MKPQHQLTPLSLLFEDNIPEADGQGKDIEVTCTCQLEERVYNVEAVCIGQFLAYKNCVTLLQLQLNSKIRMVGP